VLKFPEEITTVTFNSSCNRNPQRKTPVSMIDEIMAPYGDKIHFPEEN
jgi:hypothetical protein